MVKEFYKGKADHFVATMKKYITTWHCLVIANNSHINTFNNKTCHITKIKQLITQYM